VALLSCLSISIDARAALSRSVSGEKISIHSGRNASPFRQYVRQIKPKLRRGKQRNYSMFMSSCPCLVAKFSKRAPTRANLPECHPGDRSLTLTNCDGEIAESICPKQNLGMAGRFTTLYSSQLHLSPWRLALPRRRRSCPAEQARRRHQTCSATAIGLLQTPVSGRTSSTRSAALRSPAISAMIERTCS